MSGGYYDSSYLWAKDEDMILGGYYEGPLNDMADDLVRLGYANDAAQETRDVVTAIREAKAKIQKHLGRIQGVWKALDYWKSCDSSEESLKKALAEYRGEGK